MTPAVAITGLLAMVSVSLWTLRVALTARNHKAMAAVAASVEATVFALAFSRLLSSLDSVVQIAAYATGVGCGTLLGLTINDRLSRAAAPVASPHNFELVDELITCIADWDNLEGRASGHRYLPTIDAPTAAGGTSHRSAISATKA